MKARLIGGFSLIQVSVILTIAALAMVAVLPSSQTKLTASGNTTAKMNAVLFTLRQYQSQYNTLPCPADASLPLGSSNYGKAAQNGGITYNCGSGTPSANYIDSTNNIAIGMVPVRTLGLSNDYAVDNFGRYITYAVDTNATGCQSSSTLTGQIVVYDNGTFHNTVAALISHGADGHGAWIPMPGSTSSGKRLNAGVTDTDTNIVNAHGVSGPSFPSNYSTINTLVTSSESSTKVTFVRKTPTSTFDDIVVYQNPLWSLNTLPQALSSSGSSSTYPSSGTYYAGLPWNFSIYFSTPVTVTGTPQLDLTALGGGSNILSSGTAYATYVSGSGTNLLTFNYMIGSSDVDSSGISVAYPIDVSNGSISANDYCFSGLTLPGVLIGTGRQWWPIWFYR